MKIKAKARQMYFSGIAPAEIKKELQIEKHTLEKWSIDWLAEIQYKKLNATRQRLDYIAFVEEELFNELRKKQRNNSYINALVHNYSTFLV